VGETVDTDTKGTGQLDALGSTGASIQVILFGVGGLIHVAVGLAGGYWRLLDESFRIFTGCLIKRDLAGGVNGVDLAVVHLVRGHQTDPAMVMVSVVSVEEGAAETSGVLDTAEAFGKARLILHRLKVTFGERIVVGRVRTVMRSGDADWIGKQHPRRAQRETCEIPVPNAKIGNAIVRELRNPQRNAAGRRAK
jgi:hypothetical protein